MGEEFKIPNLPLIGPNRKPDETEVNPAEDIISEEPKKQPAEKFECPYKVPQWNGKMPRTVYSFEVLKNGQIVEEIKNLQAKPFHIFGRLTTPTVDINSAHPTTSRFHCILQYRPAIEQEEDEVIHEKQKQIVEEGWYLYDLGNFF